MTYSITKLSREFGVTARTLRFYESEGILQPAHRGTTRVFSEQDRLRLAFALRARRLGLSLAEIREIACLYGSESHGEDARHTLQRLGRIREHRQRLLSRIADANDALQAIDELEAKVLAAMKIRPDTANDSQLPLALT